MTFLDRVRAEHQVWAPPFPDTPMGMVGEDLPLYRAWRELAVPAMSLAFFNVRVGPIPEVVDPPAPEFVELERQLLSLRIDALTWDGAAWWIIEYHRQAGLAQYGRLLGYRDLLRRTYPEDVDLMCLAVAYTVNPYLLPLFERAGIGVWIWDLAEQRFSFVVRPTVQKGG